MTEKQVNDIRVEAFYAGASDALDKKTYDPMRYSIPMWAIKDYKEGFESL